ncbi:MAG TPA: hypothetical protein VH417_00780 [Vicinamibacterales bacterium]|jgi:hypothetical protein
MIRYALAIATLLVLVPRPAYPDGRINGRMDFSRTSVEGAYNDVGLGWQGLEVELENEFKTNKVVLSGFSFGIRRELFRGFSGFGTARDVHRWDEGTYFMFRMYRHFAVGGNSWSIGPSFAIFYGIPGTTLDRTIGATHGDAGYDYTHIFPIRNTELPKLVAETADVVNDSALFYPEAAVSLRRRIAGGGIVLEWVAGVRVIRFGIVDSNSQGDLFSEKRLFIPSIGLRVGFRIF